MKTHGNTMTHITKGSFNAIEIPLPPLLEQKRIVAEIERLAESIDAAKELVDKYESEIRDVVESLWHG
jgi:type I restriction enzyme S subunit